MDIITGDNTKTTIYKDSDWTTLQSANPTWILRTDYEEWSEGKLRQMNFVLRFGFSDYNKTQEFVINKFELSN